VQPYTSSSAGPVGRVTLQGARARPRPGASPLHQPPTVRAGDLRSGDWDAEAGRRGRERRRGRARRVHLV